MEGHGTQQSQQMQQPVAGSSKPRRTRTGCQNCRKRKVRCDEQKPLCRACHRLSLECAYPSAATSPRRTKYRVRFAGSNKGDPDLGDGGDGVEATPSHAGFTNTSPEVFNNEHGFQVDSRNPTLSDPTSVNAGPVLDTPTMGFDLFEDAWAFMDFAGDPEVEFVAPQGFIPEGHSLDMVNQPNLESTQGLAEHHPPRQQPVSAAECNPKFVEINESDQEPLHHFLNTMTKYSKMKTELDENVYTAIFSTLALSHRQLFMSMMAWSSLHLAQLRKQSMEEVQKRYQSAYQLLIDDIDTSTHLGVTMATIWFLLQYQFLIADGIEKSCHLLDLASNALQILFEQNDKDGAMARLGPIGMRIIIWMSAFDARAALFGKSGKLLLCLKGCPYIYDLIDQSNVRLEMDSRSQSRGELHNARLHGDPHASRYATSLRLALRLRMVMGQIKLLKFHPESEKKSRAWMMVDSELRMLRGELSDRRNMNASTAQKLAEGQFMESSDISSDIYNVMMLLATFYGAVILYQESRPIATAIPVDEFLPARDCALRLIRLANSANSSRPDSPQSIWPHLLFLAGVVCKDPVYVSWIIKTLEGAERWGKNVRKTRDLLEAIVDRQNRTGEREDPITIMEQTTGLFII